MSAIVVDEPSQLDKIIKNARRNKFHKALKNVSEIKANASSPELRKYLLEKMNGVKNLYAVHCILDKQSLKDRNKMSLLGDPEKLYNYVAGSLADALTINSNRVEIHVDRAKNKQILRDKFDSVFEDRLKNGSIIENLSIHHSNSEKFSGIQFADLLAWVVYQKYNNANPSYFDFIDDKAIHQTTVELLNKK